jgi:hypothetical protein
MPWKNREQLKGQDKRDQGRGYLAREYSQDTARAEQLHFRLACRGK